MDAFGEDVSFDLGAEHKVKLEARLRLLEEGNLRRLSGTGKVKAKFEKYHAQSEVKTYEVAYDNTLPVSSKKRKHSEVDTPKKLIEELPDEEQAGPSSEKKKKKIKLEQEEKSEPMEDEGEAAPESAKKKKKKKAKQGDVSEKVEEVEEPEEPVSEKKKKKKKKVKSEDDE